MTINIFSCFSCCSICWSDDISR